MTDIPTTPYYPIGRFRLDGYCEASEKSHVAEHEGERLKVTVNNSTHRILGQDVEYIAFEPGIKYDLLRPDEDHYRALYRYSDSMRLNTTDVFVIEQIDKLVFALHDGSRLVVDVLPGETTWTDHEGHSPIRQYVVTTTASDHVITIFFNALFGEIEAVSDDKLFIGYFVKGHRMSLAQKRAYRMDRNDAVDEILNIRSQIRELQNQLTLLIEAHGDLAKL